MKMLFHSILFANRKHRNMAVSAAIWLLRRVRDVEEHEMHRFETELDKLDPPHDCASKRVYAAIEDDYSECEYSLEVIDSALEDIALAYGDRF